MYIHRNFVVSLPKIPFMHHIHVWFWPTLIMSMVARNGVVRIILTNVHDAGEQGGDCDEAAIIQSTLMAIAHFFPEGGPYFKDGAFTAAAAGP